jgi:hypothetical protein
MANILRDDGISGHEPPSRQDIVVKRIDFNARHGQRPARPLPRNGPDAI